MKKILLIGLVALTVLSACTVSRQKLSPQGNLNLKSANVYFAQKDNEKSLEKAYGLYTKILADNPRHAIALKHIADLDFYYALKVETKYVEKDNKKELVNLDKAPEAIKLFKVTYSEYDSVVSIMKTFTDLKDDEKKMVNDATKKKESSWVRMFKIAQILTEQDHQNYELAISTFEMLNKFNPAKQEPLRMLVGINQEQKNYAKVETYIKQIIALNPKSVDIEMVRLLGSNYYNQENYADAMVYFKQVQEKDPVDTNNLLLLAGCFVKLQQNQNALDAINKVLKIEPENMDALISAKELANVLEDKTAEISYMKRILARDQSAKNLQEYVFRMVNFQMYDDLMSYAELWFNKDTQNKTAVSTCILIANKTGRKDLEKKYTEIYKTLP